MRGGRLNHDEKKSQGHLQQKVGKSQDVSGMGRLTIF